MRFISQLNIDDFIQEHTAVMLIGATDQLFNNADKAICKEWVKQSINGYKSFIDIEKYSKPAKSINLAKMFLDAYKKGRTGIDTSGDWYVHNNLLFRIVSTNLPAFNQKHIAVMVYQLS